MNKGYRTLLAALVGIGALLGGLSLTQSEKMYDSLMWGVVGIVLSLSTRSAAEALGKGSGVKGAVAALMTSAKPGDPTP